MEEPKMSQQKSKYIFIYNPESGQGKLKKNLNYILDSLVKKYGEIEILKTTHQNHANEFLKESGENYDYVFASGGDGTLNEIVNGIATLDKKPVIGYIPTGTVNDVARSLKISRNPKKAVKVLTDGEVFEHDIFKVNDHFGTYVCCSGLFSLSSYKTPRKEKKAFGMLSYIRNGCNEIITAKPIELEFQSDLETIKTSSALILISNSRSTASFLFNKKAVLNDGKVDVFIFKSHKKFILLSEMLKVVRGFLFGIPRKRNKSVIFRQVDKFKLTVKDETPINIDGEKALDGSFDFEVIPKGLKILVPKKVKKKHNKHKNKIIKKQKSNKNNK